MHFMLSVLGTIPVETVDSGVPQDILDMLMKYEPSGKFTVRMINPEPPYPIIATNETEE